MQRCAFTPKETHPSTPRPSRREYARASAAHAVRCGRKEELPRDEHAEAVAAPVKVRYDVVEEEGMRAGSAEASTHSHPREHAPRRREVPSPRMRMRGERKESIEPGGRA